MGRITESFYKMLAEHIKVYLNNIEDISYVVEKVNNIEQKINVLEDIRAQVGKLDDLRSRIDNLNNRCTDLKTEQWRTKDALENNLIEKIASSTNEIKARIGDANELNSRIAVLQELVARLEKEKAELNQSCQYNQNQIELLEQNLKTTQEDVANKSEEIALQQQRIKVMQKEKETLSAERGRLQDDLHDARSAAGKAENRAQQWVDKLSAYGDLYDAIQQCPSMSDFFKTPDRLTANTKEDALIQLVIMVGQTNAFAKDLYYYLRDMKKNNNEYLTDSEVNILAQINQCYRNACHIDFDIFFMPGGQEIGTSFVQTEFNREESEDINNPKKKNFEYVKGVYVPGLRNLKGRVSNYSLVDGCY